MTLTLSRPWSRMATLLVAAFSLVTLASCGYNTIPTLEEHAKAKWADVQNNYQRRADLIPNLVATVEGYAKQEKDVLTSVVEARAKATQVRVDARQLTDPEKMKQFQDAQNQLQRRARPADRDQRELSRPEVEPELPGAAEPARRHREPHRRGAARLHRGGARLQHRDQDLSRPDLGHDPRQQADGRVHRQRGRAEAAAGEVREMTHCRERGTPVPLMHSLATPQRCATEWRAPRRMTRLGCASSASRSPSWPASALALTFPPLTGASSTRPTSSRNRRGTRWSPSSPSSSRSRASSSSSPR